MVELLKKEFEKLESVISQKEKRTNKYFRKQVLKIKCSLVLLNNLVKGPAYKALEKKM